MITTDTLTGSTSGAVTNLDTLPRMIATAWVNFDGSGVPSIRDSENVTGVVRESTGKYTVTFSEPMNNANYCSQITSGNINGVTSGSAATATSISVNSFQFILVNNAGSNSDRDWVQVQISGGRT